MYDLIMVRFGEMTLKKQNYRQFLQKITHNIVSKCSAYPDLTFRKTDFRFYINLNGVDYQKLIEILDTVVGLWSYSLCKKTEPDYDIMARDAIVLIEEVICGSTKTFKVATNRGNKAFPATSIEISQELARRILPNISGLTVDVHNPDLTLSVDLRNEGTYIFVKTIKGLGGYPSGIAGKGLLMMSGGIDSPVAGFLALRKGVNITAIHYASPPYTSGSALQKVVDLLEILANYTSDGKIRLLVVPFTKIQDAIHSQANEAYMVTIMRRAMYKMASIICQQRNIDVIVNGESIGQVASQTLESIKVVNEITNVPIIRPLATYDKEEIVELARKIKTFDVSIRPYEDCCTVFLPEHPIIKPKIARVIFEESKCALEPLIIEAIENIEEIKVDCLKKHSVYQKEDFEI
ncbi:MAG TPA: tRNA uracil 4-sulfurtransferase ThiI [Bacilli bacterium]|nr:tRNA uracil 4-sulfurtransferase ThiI [Bacilli bacterium]